MKELEIISARAITLDGQFTMGLTSKVVEKLILMNRAIRGMNATRFSEDRRTGKLHRDEIYICNLEFVTNKGTQNVNLLDVIIDAKDYYPIAEKNQKRKI